MLIGFGTLIFTPATALIAAYYSWKAAKRVGQVQIEVTQLTQHGQRFEMACNMATSETNQTQRAAGAAWLKDMRELSELNDEETRMASILIKTVLEPLADEIEQRREEFLAAPPPKPPGYPEVEEGGSDDD